MQILTTTPLALAIYAGIVLLGPARGLWLFFATMPLGTAAVFNLPGLGSLSLIDGAVLALWAALLLHPVGGRRLLGTLAPGRPGFALALLVVFCALSAIFLPRVLAGRTDVFVLVREAGRASIALDPLHPVPSNLSQLIRLVIAASGFWLLATVYRISPDAGRIRTALIVATLLHAGLSVVDLGSHAAGWPTLLDGLRTANVAVLDGHALLGFRRLIAGYPEASAFSYYTIGLFGFWLRLWAGGRGGPWAGVMLTLVVLMLLRSTSSAAYVSAAVFCAALLVASLISPGRRHRAARLHLAVLVLLPAVAGATMLGYAVVPRVAALADSLLFDKLTSHSGIERMAWNWQALRNLEDTWGLGAGLGSVRASSWLFTSLGSLGLIGTAVFVWFIGAALTARVPPACGGQSPAAGRDRADAAEIAAALQAGCAATLVQSILTKPYPNLEVPFFAMAGLAVGLCRHAALEARGARTDRRHAQGAVVGDPAPVAARRLPRRRIQGPLGDRA